jgi:hypothetical protein
LFAKGFQPFA